MAKLLILEDDPEIRDAVKTELQDNLYVVDDVDSGNDAIDFLSRYQYDLALLDIEVPGLSGLEVLKHIRSHWPSIKVILLTSRSSIEDRLNGFGQGADDYLPKPFDMRELLVRIAAVMRRPAEVVDDLLVRGNLSLNRKLFEVRKDGQLVKLLPKDFSLLEFLMQNDDGTFSAEALLDKVWSADSHASIDGLRMAVSRLRKAIDKPGSGQSVIVSVNRVGYRLGKTD